MTVHQFWGLFCFVFYFKREKKNMKMKKNMNKSCEINIKRLGDIRKV